MGRINKHSNGDRVNQYRKIQGEFQKEQDQDIEALLLSKNGNNIQEKNTPNIDDLPNIPAILDYALNLPSQGSIKHIDGGTAHNPTAQAFLTFLTALSAASAASAAPAIFPNISASSNKAISTDTPNGLLSGVTSATGKMPVLFNTTPATTSTSQNHDQSKKLTKHSDDQSLIREKRAVGDGLIQGNADGNIILSNNGSKLTFSHHLDIDILKEQLENSNITKLCLWAVKIDPQKVQEIGNFLKGSSVKELSILHGSIRNIGAIDFGTMLTGTKVTTLNLAYNGIGNKSARHLIKSLKGTNVEELNLSHNRIGDTEKGAKGLITLLKKTNVKVLDLSDNNMSDKKVNDIIPELVGTKIIEMYIDRGIERNTLKKLLKVLKQNRHVNKEPTSTIESSTTEEEFPHTSSKREKRDIHTTSSTEDTTVLKEEPTTTVKSTVPTTDVSSTTATESTAASTSTTAKQETIAPITVKSTVLTTDVSSTTVTESTAASTSTTAKQETIAPITVKSTVLTTDVSSTTVTESTAASTSTTAKKEPTTPTTVSTTTKSVTTSSTEGSTTTEQETAVLTMDVSSTTTIESTTSATENSTTTEQETILPITEEFSTTTKSVTTSSTEDSTTTEQETILPITEEFSTTTKRVTTSSTEGLTTTEQETTVPTTEEFSTTTTKSTASSAGNPTTDSATVWSNHQKTTTFKEELTTPKESNPNDPASSAMSIEKILGLISFVVTTIGVGGGVAIYAIKKFCGGVSRLGHEALALGESVLVDLDNRLDNNEETSSLTGTTVDDNVDV